MIEYQYEIHYGLNVKVVYITCISLTFQANLLLYRNYVSVLDLPMLGGVPVLTAWRVLMLRMEERPPAMEVSCEYIE
jgi:hypothetical protein